MSGPQSSKFGAPGLHKLFIAIVGCGTAGLAAAAFLSQDGHDVVLFEKFDAPKPLGAGLLLQPTGLACLAALGLDQHAIQRGAVINHLYGRTYGHREIFNVSYADLHSRCFGVGIHRGALFQLLFTEVQRLAIPIETNCDAVDTHLIADKRDIEMTDGRRFGPYDLVIDASGRNSNLRPQNLERLNKQYPFGAIWGIVEDQQQAFGRDYLQQRYDGANIMAGMLAIGKGPEDLQNPGNNHEKCTFFWSLPPGGYENWLQQGIDSWKSQVIHYWPELMPFMEQFQSPNDLIFAQYGDIILRQWHLAQMAFIGDAGHNSSPQLGQGANLALCDALVLARSLQESDDLNQALNQYSAARKSHIRFYQLASRWLTPFFQSNSKLCSVLRDNSFALMGKTPWLKTQMLRTLVGVKTGPFSHLEPGDWHSAYSIEK